MLLILLIAAAGAVLTYKGGLSGNVALQPNTCFDSDGGIEINMPGNAISPDGTLVVDTCDIDRTKPSHYYNLMKEAYCDGNTVRTQDIPCPEGRCYEGRCIPQEYTKIPVLKPCKITGTRGILDKTSIELPNGVMFESSCLEDGRVVFGICTLQFDTRSQFLQIAQCPKEHICKEGYCQIKWPYAEPPYNWPAPKESEKWCRDSDNKDVMTKGAAISYNNPVIQYDNCIKANPYHTADYVRELFCEDSTIKIAEIDCPTGTKCGDGNCISGEQEKVLTIQEIEAQKKEKFRQEHPSPLPPGPLALLANLRGNIILPSAGCDKSGGNIQLKETIQFYPLASDNTFFLNPYNMIMRRGIEDTELLATATDFCLNDGTLIEFACTGTEVGQLTINCPCTDGACTGVIQKPDKVPVDVRIENQFVIDKQVLPTEGHSCVKTIEPFGRETLTMFVGAQQLKLEDKCASDNELIEYACASQFYAGELKMSCPCKEGMCVRPAIESVPGAKVLTYRDDPLTTEHTICEKSIAEIDFFKQQTRKMNPPFHSTDVCHDDKILEEFFCTGKKWEASVIVECEGGCIQGQCVKEAAVIPTEWQILPLPPGAILQEKTLYSAEPELSCEKTVDYLTKGALIFNKGLSSERKIDDVCMSQNELGELTCINNNFAGWTYLTCPCADGACQSKLMEAAPKDFPTPTLPNWATLTAGEKFVEPETITSCQKNADVEKKDAITYSTRGVQKTREDECLGQDILNEYVCVQDKWFGSLFVRCFCHDGKCLPPITDFPASVPPKGASILDTAASAILVNKCSSEPADYLKKQPITVTLTSGEQRTFFDQCADIMQLNEFTCINDNQVGKIKVSCPCLKGRCVQELLSPPENFAKPNIPTEFMLTSVSNLLDPVFECEKETADIFKKEMASFVSLNGKKETRSDTCTNPVELKEIICMNENWAANVYVTCPCLDGACNTAKTRTTPIQIGN
ncbi:MAG: hypothetical protein HY363_06135 [Candidatus Aenigmarchaeota archaeon]|nr:hypothetical protein [Candidatus Aenigmarchaeota archaeon]